MNNEGLENVAVHSTEKSEFSTTELVAIQMI